MTIRALTAAAVLLASVAPVAAATMTDARAGVSFAFDLPDGVSVETSWEERDGEDRDVGGPKRIPAGVEVLYESTAGGLSGEGRLAVTTDGVSTQGSIDRWMTATIRLVNATAAAVEVPFDFTYFIETAVFLSPSRDASAYTQASVDLSGLTYHDDYRPAYDSPDGGEDSGFVQDVISDVLRLNGGDEGTLRAVLGWQAFVTSEEVIPAPVPLPASLGLALAGVLGLGGLGGVARLWRRVAAG